MKYFKVTSKGGECCYGGNGRYSLPTKNDDSTWTPGEWMEPIEGELVPCEKGYHLCRPQDLLYWLNEEIYEAEYRGDILESDDKVVVREVRLLRKVETWTERIARLVAVWCAREALKLIDEPDPRSVEACDVAERHANGEASDDELTAAWDAARAAARAAAWDAARAAASAAAWDAARAAASAAARDAARAAARDAAWAAARAAASAAARDAAWAAARAAASAAARAAQTAKLLEMLGE